MAVVAVVAIVVAAVVAVALVMTSLALGRARTRGDELSAELAAARDDAAASAARADGAERDLFAARDELATAHAGLERDDARARSLWSLELLRVAREWAVTGGDVPGDGSAVAGTGAELAMALRMELERQREETGIPGELVSAPPADSVAESTALTALRLVEEVMAVVSRPSEGLTVATSVDAGDLVVTITLDAAGADVPAVVRDLATGAGGAMTVDGAVVEIRIPVASRA